MLNGNRLTRELSSKLNWNYTKVGGCSQGKGLILWALLQGRDLIIAIQEVAGTCYKEPVQTSIGEFRTIRTVTRCCDL